MSGNINFNGWLNDDGSENYKCRAWVNFNGTGVVAIRASGNVSSITDGGAARYRINLSSAMPDENYVVAGSVNPNGSSGSYMGSGVTTVLGANTASQVQIELRDNTNNYTDTDTVMVAIFR